jgi:hypothetical protein
MPAKPRTAGVSQPAPMTALRSAISVTTGSLGPRRTPAPPACSPCSWFDQGAWEEVLTVSAEDAEVLRGLLAHGSDAAYDIQRRVLMFGTIPVGHG